MMSTAFEKPHCRTFKDIVDTMSDNGMNIASWSLAVGQWDEYCFLVVPLTEICAPLVYKYMTLRHKG